MRVFLTGGTGSFGQGFVRLLLTKPEVQMVRVFSRDEHKQREMRQSLKSDRLSFYIGDVRDKDRLCRAMDGCNYLVHAAALKQAPLGEIEPEEFIKTNVQGTLNVIYAAIAVNVNCSLFISTDKAVEPINLYGATKMCAERAFIAADAMRGEKFTRFACTRYGNVVGTSGSVVPLYLSLRPGEATPIHDPESTRFWITLKQANDFVWESLNRMRIWGDYGKVFIPNMKAARIADVARALRPDEPVRVLGYRAGDKRHEVLNIEPRYSSDQVPLLTIQEIRDYVSAPANTDKLASA